MKALFNVIGLISMLVVATVTVAAGWSSTTKVTEVEPSNDGKLYVKFASMIDPDSCGSTSPAMLSTHTNYKVILATVLLAKTKNLDIQYRVDGCNSGKPVLNATKLP